MHSDRRPVRVLYLIDSLAVGGTERSLAATLPLLRQTDPVVCHLFPGDTLKSMFVDAGIPVISLNLPRKYPLTRAVTAIRRLLHDSQPDLIHSMLFRSDIVARLAGALTGVPVINSFVNESYAEVRFRRLSPSMRVKYRTIQSIDRLTAPLAFHFVANSAAIRQANCAALHVSCHRISVIYRGRNPERFLTPRADAVESLRSELELGSPSGPILLNVARLVLAKNQLELLRAMPPILAAHPDANLLIAGEGPYRNVLKGTIDDLGLGRSVHLLGSRLDVPDLLQLADIFVFPSLFEGHPGALVEAMFAALPAVASDIPVHRETLLDGALGLLAPLGEPPALAANVVRLLHDKAARRNFGACARASAFQRFDIHAIAAQHDDLYARLLDRWRLERRRVP